MQHAEEGTLHSYLDGELTPAEVVELERHLSVCAPCRAKLAEAKSFLGLSDELITELDKVPAGTKPPATAPKRIRPWVLRPAAIAWAASVVLAVGVGYLWHAQQGVAPLVSEATSGTEVANTPPAQPSTAHDEIVAPRPREAARRDAPPAPAPAPAPESPTALASGAVAEPTSPPLRLEVDASTAAAPSGAAGLASKSNADTRANDNIAIVQGVPVDTTKSSGQRLAFGPATTPEPKRITLDQAVDLLGGSIQLIDGLTPQRVEVLAGVDVVGADPSRQVVRVYYEEPDLGLVTLDQQRPGPSFDARRPESPTAMPQVTVAPSAPPTDALRRSVAALNTVSWRADGVWLSLTTRLPKERMAQLQARVK